MTLHTTPEAIGRAFEDVFDQAVVFHAYADFMRDYDVVVLATADPRTEIAPERLRYRFRYCVDAAATTTVGDDVWRRSLDDRLTDYDT